MKNYFSFIQRTAVIAATQEPVQMLRTVSACLVYPIMTLGSVIFCLFALGWHWPAWAVGAVVVIVCSILVEILERILPYTSEWSKSHGDWKTDIWHNVLSNRTFDIGTFIAISIFTPLGKWFSVRLGIPLWPHHWPLPVQALIALALVELPWYWLHRLEHNWIPLWRVHSVHHSSKRLYWWNVGRNHPIDNLVSAVASIALLALLGVGEEPLALVAAFSAANAALQHSNVDVRTGILDYFFTTARVHRWHHSHCLKESRANYGPTLTLWDYVFQTRDFDPTAVPPEQVGLGPEFASFPEDFLGQMVAPFDPTLWNPKKSQ